MKDNNAKTPEKTRFGFPLNRFNNLENTILLSDLVFKALKIDLLCDPNVIDLFQSKVISHKPDVDNRLADVNLRI